MWLHGWRALWQGRECNFFQDGCYRIAAYCILNSWEKAHLHTLRASPKVTAATGINKQKRATLSPYRTAKAPASGISCSPVVLHPAACLQEPVSLPSASGWQICPPQHKWKMPKPLCLGEEDEEQEVANDVGSVIQYCLNSTASVSASGCELYTEFERPHLVRSALPKLFLTCP